jgi:hypothetical protein
LRNFFFSESRYRLISENEALAFFRSGVDIHGEWLLSGIQRNASLILITTSA